MALSAPAVVAGPRPWWQARYRDGRVVSEWEPASAWEDLQKGGLVGIRLLCPDGVAAELESREDHKIFQFKVGGLTIGMGGQPLGWCDAYVIGAVLDADGSCLCRAWEARERRLVDFKDNVFDMKYQGLGPLGLDNLGIRI